MTHWLALVVLFFSTFTRAQTPTGTLAGTVTDPTGAVIAGAGIQIRSKDAGLARVPVTGGGDGLVLRTPPLTTPTGQCFAYQELVWEWLKPE